VNASPGRFRLALAACAVFGLALRIAYGLIADVPNGFGDDVWYHEVANGLAGGRGFSDPFNTIDADGQRAFGNDGEPIATAFHLPLFPALLALFSVVGIDSYTAHQVIGCALGAATVGVCGLVARRLAGEAAGIAAAALAAVFLPLVIRDSLLMSESLYGLLIALVLLATLRLRDEPAWRNALALGTLVGLAALTRSEALLFVLLLALPAVWRRPCAARNLAIVCAAVAVLCAPWAIRNTLEFDQPTLLTTGDGSVFAGANLRSTYYGGFLGAWDFNGLYRSEAGRSVSLNEAVQSDRWRSEGLDYARDHTGRVPAVVAVRVLRTFELYPLDPFDRAEFAETYYNHVKPLEYALLPLLLVAAGLALFAALALRRGGVAVWPFAAPILLVVLVSALGYGDTRFRHAADVALVILAGIGLVLARERWTRAGITGSP
jgi:4-amino-4-deoxy-L-arabinose transferase-like glycosyltransferase